MMKKKMIATLLLSAMSVGNTLKADENTPIANIIAREARKNKLKGLSTECQKERAKIEFIDQELQNPHIDHYPEQSYPDQTNAKTVLAYDYIQENIFEKMNETKKSLGPLYDQQLMVKAKEDFQNIKQNGKDQKVVSDLTYLLRLQADDISNRNMFTANKEITQYAKIEHRYFSQNDKIKKKKFVNTEISFSVHFQSLIHLSEIPFTLHGSSNANDENPIYFLPNRYHNFNHYNDYSDLERKIFNAVSSKNNYMLGIFYSTCGISDSIIVCLTQSLTDFNFISHNILLEQRHVKTSKELARMETCQKINEELLTF
jgi:hypothetical protein